MNAYSAKLFPEDVTEVSENFLAEAREGEFCFVENMPAASYEGKVEQIILFKWNRLYPADSYFDIDLSGWELVGSEDFIGSSHDKITMETYQRRH
ncbi:MAG: hypothetical protein LUG99_23235 [Lachnospiraceae bacterium]|nr:hypothetical protein [Lachnospiraceae bacterium]